MNDELDLMTDHVNKVEREKL